MTAANAGISATEETRFRAMLDYHAPYDMVLNRLDSSANAYVDELIFRTKRSTGEVSDSANWAGSRDTAITTAQALADIYDKMLLEIIAAEIDTKLVNETAGLAAESQVIQAATTFADCLWVTYETFTSQTVITRRADFWPATITPGGGLPTRPFDAYVGGDRKNYASDLYYKIMKLRFEASVLSN